MSWWIYCCCAGLRRSCTMAQRHSLAQICMLQLNPFCSALQPAKPYRLKTHPWSCSRPAKAADPVPACMLSASLTKVLYFLLIDLPCRHDSLFFRCAAPGHLGSQPGSYPTLFFGSANRVPTRPQPQPQAQHQQPGHDTRCCLPLLPASPPRPPVPASRMLPCWGRWVPPCRT